MAQLTTTAHRIKLDATLAKFKDNAGKSPDPELCMECNKPAEKGYSFCTGHLDDPNYHG